MQDSFIKGITDIAKILGIKVDPSFFFGTTGHGARISLAMNVKSGREIGHPSSIYCWDVVSVVDQCFVDAGIDATLFVGEGYFTRARKTAVEAKRKIPSNIIILQHNKFPQLQGQLLVADPRGFWMVADSTSDLEVETTYMPFGPVVLQIHDILPQWNFPKSTLRYLIQTLERGEEPMEVPGKDHYSTISGWKAYARWMQSFKVPLPNIQHDFISNLPSLLHERRKMNTEYWNTLQQSLTGKEQGFAIALQDHYQAITEQLVNLINQEQTERRVRDVYYEEQRTQVIYKKIGTYLNQEDTN